MNTKRFSPSRILIYFILIVGSLIMAYPLAFGLSASFSTLEAYNEGISAYWFPLPNPVDMSNYAVLLSSQANVLSWVLNTLWRAVWHILIPGLIAISCGYVFARLKFKGRDAMFIFLLSSLTIPGIVYYVPTYVMLARWPLAGGNNLFGQGGSGFANEWPALLIPGLVNAYYIFLMRQSFYSIPNELDEAARLDGANTWQILTRIHMPLLKAPITVMVIFQFVFIWNDYLWPLISVSGNESVWSVALGFERLMFSGGMVKAQNLGTAFIDYPFAFALATVALVPTLLLFLFLQRYFVEGVQGFGVK